MKVYTIWEYSEELNNGGIIEAYPTKEEAEARITELSKPNYEYWVDEETL